MPVLVTGCASCCVLGLNVFPLLIDIVFLLAVGPIEAVGIVPVSGLL